MESIKRKRVTRVGSGAFSIYLPKKWIDAWLPEQQDRREVDLRQISQSILISPVLQDRTLERKVPVDQTHVTRLLLSGYVRGKNEVRLLPPDGGQFDNECVMAARDFLRHLDERLVTTSNRNEIGYRLDAALSPSIATGGDLVGVLTAKVREVLDLAADAVQTFRHDADRTLHTLQLLRTVDDEDVQRLFHQAMRLVNTLELPMKTVSDYQLLGLVAAEMHQISGNAVKIADTIMEAYGLESSALDYPRAHLLEKMGDLPGHHPVAQELVRSYRKPFQDARTLLLDLVQAYQRRDMDAMQEVLDQAPRQQDALLEANFAAVAEHWGVTTDPETATVAYSAGRIASPLGNILDSIRMIAQHTLALMAAELDA